MLPSPTHSVTCSFLTDSGGQSSCAGDIDEWSQGQSFILKLPFSVYAAVHSNLYSRSSLH